MEFKHYFKNINTISVIGDQETNLMKDITDLDDDDENQNVIVKEEDTDGQSKRSILKTRKAPIVSNKPLRRDEQEIEIKREFSSEGEKISSNIPDKSPQEIVSLMGKFMRDTLFKFLEAWRGEQGSNIAESLKY